MKGSIIYSKIHHVNRNLPELRTVCTTLYGSRLWLRNRLFAVTLKYDAVRYCDDDTMQHQLYNQITDLNRVIWFPDIGVQKKRTESLQPTSVPAQDMPFLTPRLSRTTGILSPLGVTDPARIATSHRQAAECKMAGGRAAAQVPRLRRPRPQPPRLGLPRP